jgi:hypothetical protein
MHYYMTSCGFGGEAPRILDHTIIQTLVDSFTFGKRAFGTQCIGGHVGPRTV